MLLDNKTAVIYGAGGAVGAAVARAFAREGATLFLAGRHLPTVQAVAHEVAAAAGGRVHAAEVDVLDAEAVARHAADVVARSGRFDVSFNLVSWGDAQGASLVDISPEHFLLPIETAMRAHFVTATAAVRHMRSQGSGVILALTAQAARKPYSDNGGFGVAGAALEALCRQLALEAGPSGIRVVCLRSAGSPDTPGVAEAWGRHAAAAGMPLDEWEAGMADGTMLKRLPRLAEVADVAVLMASDHARTVTAAVTNLTCGELAD
jgi:NAD(P)-dependent dehydrogenase (short-subunit alcohol dehydrogenase family)